MGLFWDLIQQSQISSQRSRASSLEDRVHDLEDQVDALEDRLRVALEILELRVGEDLDGDGRVG